MQVNRDNSLAECVKPVINLEDQKLLHYYRLTTTYFQISRNKTDKRVFGICFAVFPTYCNIKSQLTAVDNFFFQSNFSRIRETRHRKRNELQKPKPGKLHRFLQAVFSVITLECCRRKAIPKMTAPVMFFLLPTSFQSKRSLGYHGDGH